MDSFAQDGRKIGCKPFADTIEDLAVSVAGCRAERLLGARTPRNAKRADIEHMRKRLSPLSETDRRSALTAAFRLADEKLKQHGDDVHTVVDELMRRWSVKVRVARIERNTLIELLGGSRLPS
jgi:hypothetical protein